MIKECNTNLDINKKILLKTPKEAIYQEMIEPIEKEIIQELDDK